MIKRIIPALKYIFSGKTILHDEARVLINKHISFGNDFNLFGCKFHRKHSLDNFCLGAKQSAKIVSELAEFSHEIRKYL